MNPKIGLMTLVLGSATILALIATYSGDWLVLKGTSKMTKGDLEIGTH